MDWFAEKLQGAALNHAVKPRILAANTALEVLGIAGEHGIDIAAIVAADARARALETLRGADVSVDIIVTDRSGRILAHAV